MLPLYKTLRKIIDEHPEVTPYLMGKARFFAFAKDGEYKTYDFFLETLTRLIRSVYTGLLNGEFIDIMASLLQGQIMQAYEQAWIDDGNYPPMPQSLVDSANAFILNQYNYVDQFYRDIIDARVDNTPVSPLVDRAKLWANQYNSAYAQANAKIALEMGGKLIWVEGDTKDKCATCQSLDGVVDYAKEWERAGLMPANAPNEKIDCGGWNCQCQLLPTEQRRTYGGLAKLGY